MPVTRCYFTMGLDLVSDGNGSVSAPKDVFKTLRTTRYGIGTGPGEVANEWSDERQILAPGNDDFDLSGVTTNRIGELQVFVRIKGFFLVNLSEASNLAFGGGPNAAPLFVGSIGPGGRIGWEAGETDPGKLVVPGTADMIRITSDAPDARYAIAIFGVATYDAAAASGSLAFSAVATSRVAIAARASGSASTGSLATSSLLIRAAASGSVATYSYAASTIAYPP
jgi:hypothetical protein